MIDQFQTPDWVHHAVFYQIFPDRFAASQSVVKPTNLEDWSSPPTPYGFKGGDLVGVVEKMDYLQDLGINAIYFTPVFSSASNHRYHTHDYFTVDPLLGGNHALRTLVDEAHRRGIRIVLDGVFNHASRGFFQFNHILECGPKSPYVDWFTVHGYPLHAYEGSPNYNCWVGLPALPTFNHANPQVRDYIYDIARYWIDQGIDGWRLDVPFEIKEAGFWEGFRQVVKQANPDAYITGEIPWDADQWLQGDQFDSVMNYLFTYTCLGFFGGDRLDRSLVGHWYGHGPDYFRKDAEGFLMNAERLLNKYPKPAVLAQLNLLDSHDTARAISQLGNDKAAFKLATLFQMTYPGAPCVYYGNEIGLSGGMDPDCRRAFPWDEAQWDFELLSYFKQLISLRHAHPALRDGEFKPLLAKDGIAAYYRGLGEDHLVVVINNSERTIHPDIPMAGMLVEGTVLKSFNTAGEGHVSNGRLSGFSLAPKTGIVLL